LGFSAFHFPAFLPNLPMKNREDFPSNRGYLTIYLYICGRLGFEKKKCSILENFALGMEMELFIALSKAIKAGMHSPA
jgi:hypothetical protein